MLYPGVSRLYHTDIRHDAISLKGSIPPAKHKTVKWELFLCNKDDIQAYQGENKQKRIKSIKQATVTR